MSEEGVVPSVRREWAVDRDTRPSRVWGPVWREHAGSGAVCRREPLGHDIDPLIDVVRMGWTPPHFKVAFVEGPVSCWTVHLPADVHRVLVYSVEDGGPSASAWTCRTPQDAALLVFWLEKHHLSYGGLSDVS